MTASDSRIAAIAADHHDTDPFGFCAECGQGWPCDASVLAGMLTPERLSAALPADLAYWEDRIRHGDAETERDGLARAFLAALEAQP